MQPPCQIHHSSLKFIQQKAFRMSLEACVAKFSRIDGQSVVKSEKLAFAKALHFLSSLFEIEESRVIEECQSMEKQLYLRYIAEHVNTCTRVSNEPLFNIVKAATAELVYGQKLSEPSIASHSAALIDLSENNIVTDDTRNIKRLRIGPTVSDIEPAVNSWLNLPPPPVAPSTSLSSSLSSQESQDIRTVTAEEVYGGHMHGATANNAQNPESQGHKRKTFFLNSAHGISEQKKLASSLITTNSVSSMQDVQEESRRIVVVKLKSESNNWVPKLSPSYTTTVSSREISIRLRQTTIEKYTLSFIKAQMEEVLAKSEIEFK